MSPPRIRVLVVDDQALFREGVRTLLSVHDDLEVAGEAATGEEAVRKVAELRPAVVLMDLRMPGAGGVEATRQLRACDPEVRVIILTTFDDDEEVLDALRAGAVGYLLKDSTSMRLVEAIRLAARGESLLQPSIAAKVVAELQRLPPQRREPLAEPLSERELQVLRLLASGWSNREISRRVHLAEGTVKNHVTAILSKLAVRDRTQAALRAREIGWL